MHSDGKNSACVLKDLSNTDTVGLKARSGENWITGAQVHCKLQALALEPQQGRCQQDVDQVLSSIREQNLVYSAQHALDIHTSLCHMDITVDATMYQQLCRRSPVTNSERVANAILAIIPGKGMVPGLVHGTRVRYCDMKKDPLKRGASPERYIHTHTRAMQEMDRIANYLTTKFALKNVRLDNDAASPTPPLPSVVQAVDRAHTHPRRSDDEGREIQGALSFGKPGAQVLFSGGIGRGSRNGETVQARAAPISPMLPTPTPSTTSDCPHCEAIYDNLSELLRQQGLLVVERDAYVSEVLTGELIQMCQQISRDPYGTCQFIGCYITQGNATTVDPRQPDTRGARCDQVPFCKLAHIITAYALNGSDMRLNVRNAASPPLTSIAWEVPNSWFIQTALNLNHVIDGLPSEVRQALKLAQEEAEPFPSIREVFDRKIENATLAYIRVTSASWPWTPPPPPPPPTPPPCPGGSLKACMGLCPNEPISEYKKCVQQCFDVCHGA
eukprot:CAMPEP_0179485274 /NCGR_PEP_ID=MMETSP0799-20121207/61941_1 /TAXON_ID=46947 /ORGANISM="Geminigera cryophila, Strain CCMP2564" /LENGTH=499 /DNA_ID=CAMNT_0021299595 /DNA_START=172 /DNA_END=1672 /DNA_ORIENTATION=-